MAPPPTTETRHRLIVRCGRCWQNLTVRFSILHYPDQPPPGPDDDVQVRVLIDAGDRVMAELFSVAHVGPFTNHPGA